MNSSQHSLPRHAKGPRIAVVGSGRTDPRATTDAESVGRGLGAAGATLICGGRGGVMEAAARACRGAGGLTVGIMPGADSGETPPNDWIDIPIYTAAGQGRNLIVVLTAQVVIAVGGGWGTLSEVALARKHGRAVVVLGPWRIETPESTLDDDLVRAGDATEAVRRALELAEVETQPAP